MIEGLLGRKIGMTQVFSEAGEAIPVTVIEVGPCIVTQIRNKERDGYEAVQLGFGDVKPKSLTKPEQGHLAGAGRLVRHLREFDADNIEDHQVGQVLSADVFEPGQVDRCRHRSWSCLERYTYGRPYGQPPRNRAELAGC